MRYERKYKVDDINLPLVQQIIKSHPYSFRQNFPDRQVNNIYFDTPDHQTFFDNVVGAPERSKYRLRWYGPIREKISKPRFEIKFKSFLLGSKRVIELDDFHLDDLAAVQVKIAELAPKAGVLKPVLSNAYQRSYYKSLNGLFRITIDSELKFSHAGKSGILGLNGFAHKFPGIIVELKYEDLYDDLANEVMQYIPFRNSKNSKYITGLSMIMT